MTIKDKADRATGPYIRPTSNFHRYAEKNSGGRFAAKTPETPFEALMHKPRVFKYRPLRPPLKGSN